MNNSINGINRSRNDGLVGTARTLSNSREANVKSEDSVALTTTAEALPSLARAMAAEPELDMARVDTIKSQIIGGQYRIDAEQVASRYLQIERELGGI